MSAFSFLPSFSLERELIEKGYSCVAGIDEAGRGALAGPLAVGLVIFNEAIIFNNPSPLDGINDSKKMTPRKRREAEKIISRLSLFSTAAMVSHKIIDKMNINRATELALNNLLRSIPIKPDILIMDGNFSFDLGIPFLPIKGGDGSSLSIAAASIMAKVRRDTILERFDAMYPGYNFRKNKGYGTREHIASIREKGISPIHRLSYEPVKGMLAGYN